MNSAKNQPYQSVLSDYQIIGGQPLGKGASSFVYKVQSRVTNDIYAMKVLDKKTLAKQKTAHATLNEIRIQSQMKCPFIAELYHYFEDEESIYIILEYVQGNELQVEIKSLQAMKANYNNNVQLRQDGSQLMTLDESEAAGFFSQIAQGVKYMQERNVLHRDIKMSNIMVSMDKNVKIIDFGLAVQLSDFIEEDSSICGTPNYLSPETIQGKRFGPMSDLWAIGCILYMMVIGRPPFEGSSVKTTVENIKNGNFKLPSSLSPECKDLILRLLTYDPKMRITIDQVLDHPFLTGSGSNQDLQGSILDRLQPVNSINGVSFVPILGSQYISNQVEEQKFQTIEHDKEGTSSKAQRGTESRHPVQQTPAFNTAFSSAQRPQSSGVIPTKQDSAYQSILGQNEDSKRGATKIPHQQKYKRKESFRKQLEFETNEPYSNNQGTYDKLDTIKDKINRKISGIRNPLIQGSFQQPLITALLQDENQNPNTSQQVPSPYFEEDNKSRKLKTEVPLLNMSKDEPKVESKSQKREKFNAIELRPLNTERLKPVKLETETGYIKLREDGWVVLSLSKRQKKIYISPDGLQIMMKSTVKQYLTALFEYKFEKIPYKLRPWYKYAMDFVKATRQKTSRIIFANNLLTCHFMENDPLNSIEVDFVKTKNNKNVKVLYHKGSDTMQIIYKELLASTILKSLPPTPATTFEFNIHTDLDQLDPEMQHYASETLHAASICEERNLKIMKQILGDESKTTSKIELPVVIDERVVLKQK